VSELPILGFADRAAFEDWLASEGPASNGAWIRLAKGKAAMLAKAEAIDAALCHGWIDGQIAKAPTSRTSSPASPRARSAAAGPRGTARAPKS
jgi:uncharacterized protein YdeI (YjbR/CyaY-like superfamily)